MSDSDSVDSDEGIRYKTVSVRSKQTDKDKKVHRNSNLSYNSSAGDHSGEDNKAVGPALPPNISNKKSNTFAALLVGPALPPHMTNSSCLEPLYIGPALPPQQISAKECSESTIGPQLPAHLLNKHKDKAQDAIFVGPQLPPHMLNKFEESEENNVKTIGPTMPPHLLKNHEIEEPQILIGIGPQLSPCRLNKVEESEEDNVKIIEPTSPPHLIKKHKIEVPQNLMSMGPQLPPHMLNKVEENGEGNVKTIGPTLPPHLRQLLQQDAEHESEEDDESYGPLPSGMSRPSRAELALEERALQMQIDKLGPQNTQPVRESWMTELPEVKAAQFGLGPRQFRNRAGPDMSDRSSWTEIAGEKGKKTTTEKKVDLRAEAELKELQRRDKEQEQVSKKHKRKSKSLVDMHQDKLRKKEVTDKPNERRPFSRETDLQVNKFDEAQKKAIMKKAQLLDDRFSTGKSKYL